MIQRTLVILKPDALERGLELVIFDEIHRHDLSIGDVSVRPLEQDEVRAHYARLANEPYFPRIMAYMTRGPCAIIVVTGEHAVARLRALAGSTRPDEAAPGSWRNRYGVITDEGGIENVVHCSATIQEAEAEIALFFGSSEAQLE